jgi:hypothetical protein
MGRHDTVAWQRILALCTIYGVDMNIIKKKSKKILSLYSDLVVLRRENADEYALLYPAPPLDYLKALDILDQLDPDQGKHDLSVIIVNYIKVEWFTELVEKTISKLRSCPDGNLYAGVINQYFLTTFVQDDNTIAHELNVEYSRLYDRKREAMIMFGLCLWHYVIPRKRDDLIKDSDLPFATY